MNNIIFSCANVNLPVPAEDIVKILPNWKTKIIDVEGGKDLKIDFLINAKTEEEIKDWLKEFQDKSLCTYSIKSTDRVCGKYLAFKQRLHCQHNTKCKRLYNPSVKGKKTKNTNCPSTITIKLRAIKKNGYRGKDQSLAPDPEMPCSIKLLASHNHASGVDALKFRKVSEETKQKLIELFKNGHTAATALADIKLDICINSPDCSEKLLADRKYTSDYNYCYNLYKNFLKEYGPINNEKNWNELIVKWIKDFNQSTKENSAKAFFSESQYVICICSPLMRRTHKIAKASSEIVFMDSIGTVDHIGSRVYLLLTYSECDALPLAVIITSSEKATALIKGFQILKEMLGDDLFGGNINGPSIFLVNDSISEKAAIEEVWTNSKCFLCVFHVLQSVWRWLINSEQCINMDDLQKFFMDFKEIIYSKSYEECEKNYGIAVSNARMYPDYTEYLDTVYWQRKELWALVYRSNKLTRSNNNYSETELHLLKDQILERIKANNLIQLVNFLSAEFINYFKMRLLDATHNKRNNYFKQIIQMPHSELSEEIEILPGNIYLVPSELNNDLFYIVNSDVLICTCAEGDTDTLCKHFHWIYVLIYSEEYNKPIDNMSIRKQLYLIAKGEEDPQDWLSPTVSTSTINTDRNNTKFEETNNISPVVSNSITNVIKTEVMDIKFEETASVSADSSPIVRTSIRNVIKPEENYTEFEVTDTSENTDKIIDSESIIKENNNLLQSISTCIQKFAKQSPTELNNGLMEMLKNSENIKTSLAMASACSTFAKRFQRKGMKSKKPRVYRTDTNRGSSSHAGHQPHKRKCDDD